MSVNPNTDSALPGRGAWECYLLIQTQIRLVQATTLDGTGSTATDVWSRID